MFHFRAIFALALFTEIAIASGSGSAGRSQPLPKVFKSYFEEALKTNHTRKLDILLDLLPKSQSDAKAKSLGEPSRGWAIRSSFESELVLEEIVHDWDVALTPVIEEVIARPLDSPDDGIRADKAIRFWSEFAGAYSPHGRSPKVLINYLLDNHASPFNRSNALIVQEIQNAYYAQGEVIEKYAEKLFSIVPHLPADLATKVLPVPTLRNKPKLIEAYITYILSHTEVWNTISSPNSSPLAFWGQVLQTRPELKDFIRRQVLERGYAIKLIKQSPATADLLGIESSVPRSTAVTADSITNELATMTEQPKKANLNRLAELLAAAQELGIYRIEVANAVKTFLSNASYSLINRIFRRQKVAANIARAEALRDQLRNEFRSVLTLPAENCEQQLVSANQTPTRIK